jgi:hypothetical protein
MNRKYRRRLDDTWRAERVSRLSTGGERREGRSSKGWLAAFSRDIREKRKQLLGESRSQEYRFVSEPKLEATAGAVPVSIELPEPIVPRAVDVRLSAGSSEPQEPSLGNVTIRYAEMGEFEPSLAAVDTASTGEASDPTVPSEEDSSLVSTDDASKPPFDGAGLRTSFEGLFRKAYDSNILPLRKSGNAFEHGLRLAAQAEEVKDKVEISGRVEVETATKDANITDSVETSVPTPPPFRQDEDQRVSLKIRVRDFVTGVVASILVGLRWFVSWITLIALVAVLLLLVLPESDKQSAKLLRDLKPGDQVILSQSLRALSAEGIVHYQAGQRQKELQAGQPFCSVFFDPGARELSPSESLLISLREVRHEYRSGGINRIVLEPQSDSIRRIECSKSGYPYLTTEDLAKIFGKQVRIQTKVAGLR